MKKITFMGAGSTVFARNVLGDCLCSPVLREAEFALYDIDGTRLAESAEIIGAMNQTMGGHAKITTYLGVEGRPAGGGFRGERHPGGAVRPLHHHRL